jgi:hypothetical protein
VLLLARFPAVCFLFGLILDVPVLLVTGITLITSLTAVLFYGHALDTVRTQGRSSHSER